MKIIVFAFAFCLTFGQTLMAQELPSAEGDKTLTIYDAPSNTLSRVPLDSDGLIAHPPPSGGGHGGGGSCCNGGHPNPPPSHPNPPPSHPNPPPSHPNPPPNHPNPPPGGGHPGHPGEPHPNPPHPHPHPPGHWDPYPGWHSGWGWNHDWHPVWWYPGYVFPPWQWGPDVPDGYWQCTAFNGSMQAYTRIGPDENQAAYGALYACGGANFQQFGCYIPEGYCQPQE